MASTRRLAAILAADVAGYSRLMGADEEGTLERLKAHRRQLIDPKIREHHGRIVKTTGDGMLVDFPSVVDAVKCAVEVQRTMLDRNAETPEDKRITFRIGINLGDVIIDGDDICRPAPHRVLRRLTAIGSFSAANGQVSNPDPGFCEDCYATCCNAASMAGTLANSSVA